MHPQHRNQLTVFRLGGTSGPTTKLFIWKSRHVHSTANSDSVVRRQRRLVCCHNAFASIIWDRWAKGLRTAGLEAPTSIGVDVPRINDGGEEVVGR